jgi:hypothetical protein
MQYQYKQKPITFTRECKKGPRTTVALFVSREGEDGDLVELLIFGESIHDHWLGKPRKTVGKDEEYSLTVLRILSTRSFCGHANRLI